MGMNKTRYIEYTVQIWKEGEQFVAHAMPLDVMSSGRTPEEARKALDEAVHLFLVTAADIKKFLKKRAMNSRREDGSVLLGWPLKNILQPLVPEMPRITPVHWKVIVFEPAYF